MAKEEVLKIIINDEFLKEFARQEVKKILWEDQHGTWWDMKRLEAETCRKRDWLIENILLNPKFREEMKVISNNREGGRWMFRAAEMRKLLNEHFHYLNRSGKTG